MKVGGDIELDMIEVSRERIISYVSNIRGPIIYFLFNTDSSQVYVGKTLQPESRFSNHFKSKDFWDRVLIFTSSKFNNVIIDFIEHNMIERSKRANILYSFINQQSCSRPYIGLADEIFSNKAVDFIIRMLDLRGFHFYKESILEVFEENKKEGPPNIDFSSGKITFLTCCGDAAWTNCQNTLLKPVDLSKWGKGMSFAWGVNTPEKYNKINIRDIHFFVKTGQIVCIGGKVIDKIENEEISLALYGDPQFKYIYLLDNLQYLDLSFDIIKRALNYKDNFVLQGFRALNETQTLDVKNALKEYVTM
jgi:hypothetical protein